MERREKGRASGICLKGSPGLPSLCTLTRPLALNACLRPTFFSFGMPAASLKAGLGGRQIKTLAVGRVIRALPVDDRALEPTSGHSCVCGPARGAAVQGEAAARPWAGGWGRREGLWSKGGVSVAGPGHTVPRPGWRVDGSRAQGQQTWLCVLALPLLSSAASGSFLTFPATWAGKWGTAPVSLGCCGDRGAGPSAVRDFSCHHRPFCLEAKAQYTQFGTMALAGSPVTPGRWLL